MSTDVGLPILPIPFKVKVSSRGDTATVFAEGEIDISTAAEFDAALTTAIARETSYVIVDLSIVSFIESVGLGILLRGLHSLSASGRRLVVICTAESPVLHALELVDLTSRLDLQTVLPDEVAEPRRRRLSIRFRRTDSSPRFTRP